MHVHTEQDTVSDRRRRRLVAPIAAGLALSLGLAACGDSDEDATTTTTEADTPSTTAAGATGDVSAFCDAAFDVDATFAAGGPEGPDPARLEAVFEKAKATAPAEISDDVDRISELTQQAFAAGGEEEQGPPPPEVEEIDGRIDDYLLANCEVAEVAVTGTEYKFEGLDEPLEVGKTAFNFTNEGGEEHELILLRFNDGVTQSLEELAQLPPEEAFTKVEAKGFAMAPPGGSDLAFVDLEPGRYGALCFFTVGSTPEALAAAKESGQEIDGPPHFTQGMLAEFTVE